MNPFLDRGGGHSRPKGTTYAKVGEIPTLGKQKDLGWSLGAGPGAVKNTINTRLELVVKTTSSILIDLIDLINQLCF